MVHHGLVKNERQEGRRQLQLRAHGWLYSSHDRFRHNEVAGRIIPADTWHALHHISDVAREPSRMIRNPVFMMHAPADRWIGPDAGGTDDASPADDGGFK